MWYSVDAETGRPGNVHPKVRLAYMQTEAEVEPRYLTDLVFRTKPLRAVIAKRARGALVCPVENGIEYENLGCSKCELCLPKDPSSTAVLDPRALRRKPLILVN